ncbi:SMI1/KNR4 family protein [Lysinibacillus contaminans]
MNFENITLDSKESLRCILMDWKSYVDSFTLDVHYTEPTTTEQLDEAEKKLNVKLPTKLSNLLKQTNGIYDQFNCPYVWSTNKIIEDNLFFRNFEDYKNLYMPFDHLLFFSDSGCGDLFGFSILNGQVQTDAIFVWNHETDSRNWIASSLEAFLKGWITGGISI